MIHSDVSSRHPSVLPRTLCRANSDVQRNNDAHQTQRGKRWTNTIIGVCTAAATLLAVFAGAPSAVAATVEQGGDQTAQSPAFTSVGPAKAGKTTYYVDAQHGDDANTGTSSSKPWKSLAKASNVTYQAGDHVLLESGSTWNSQQFSPKGSGSSSDDGSNKIVVDLYTRQSNGTAAFTANRRPVINGNGTYSSGSFKRFISGAVQLVNVEQWTVRNMEVTNTPELGDTSGYKKHGDAQRAGILLIGYGQKKALDSLTVENCYVHDVQSEYYLQAGREGNGKDKLKAVGGIIALGHWLDPDGNIIGNPHGSGTQTDTWFTHLLIENNIVIRVGTEGIRTKEDSSDDSQPKLNDDATIKGNYLQDIAGDGIVMSEVKDLGLIEGNTVVRACNADYGQENYAALWTMSSNNVVAQYNEVYGNVHGYNDGEAFDIDMSCDHNVYQYNYSHSNGGGFMLLMSSQANSIVRYNISVNDGAGNEGTNSDQYGHGSYHYKEQSVFHYWVKDDGAPMPQIYNNTFYVGNGISASLFGEGNSSDNSGAIAHFSNNIIYKAGTGSIRFLSNYPTNGSEPTERKLHGNPERYITNNVLPESIATATSGATVDVLKPVGNVFSDPKLRAESDTAIDTIISTQQSTELEHPESGLPWNTKDVMRGRAELFKIAQDSSAVAKGARQDADQTQEDFFGGSIKDRGIDAGAHQVSNHETKTTYEAQTVAVGTVAGVYPHLPEDVDVTITETTDGTVAKRTERHAVSWDFIDAGSYAKAGTFEVQGHISNLPNAMANATVSVEGELGTGDHKGGYVATGNATVQRGSANTTLGAQSGSSTVSVDYKHPFGREYSNNQILRLKNSASAGYNRRFYVKFDTSQYSGKPSEVKNAKLRLHVSRFDSFNGAGATTQEQLRNTAFRTDVYITDAGWQTDTLTWNNSPRNADVTANNHTPLGSGETIPDYRQLRPDATQTFTNGDIIDNGYIMDIDVTSALRRLDAFSEPVSFLVDIPMSDTPNFNRDNSGLDAFSTQGAAQVYADSQQGLVQVPAGIRAPQSPADWVPQLVVSDAYVKSVTPVNATIRPGEKPNLPQHVDVTYSDGSVQTVGVHWNFEGIDLSHDGTYVVQGRGAGFPDPIAATVNVKSAVIASITQPKTLDMPVGIERTAFKPETVDATDTDGHAWSLNVVGIEDAQMGNYSKDSPAGTYRFPLSVELPLGLANPRDFRVIQEVTTHAKPRSDVTIDAPSEDSGHAGKPLELVQGGIIQFSLSDPESSVRDWIWAVTMQTQSPAKSSAVTIDDNALLTAPTDAPVGTYTVTATNKYYDKVQNQVLELFGPQDMTGLNQLIAVAQAKTPPAGQQFTTESHTALHDAIVAAQRVAGDALSTPSQVDHASMSLNAAIEALVYEPVIASGDSGAGTGSGGTGSEGGSQSGNADVSNSHTGKHQIAGNPSSATSVQPASPAEPNKPLTLTSTGSAVKYAFVAAAVGLLAVIALCAVCLRHHRLSAVSVR